MLRTTAVVVLLFAAASAQEPPRPRTSIDSARWLEMDFPSVRIGIAEYDEGPTGATIFHFPKGAKAAVDVRGGAPGTFNMDTLRLSYDSAYVDAVTFAGGSSYGLAVAGGVAEAIRGDQDTPNDLASIATVTGAIIFDVGPRRYSTVAPDNALGRAAFKAAAAGRFPLGAHGAGRFAMQSGYFGDQARVYSGQGAAFRQIGVTKIAVFTVVNSLGAIVDRAGNIVRCRQGVAPACGTISERLGRGSAPASASLSREDDLSTGPASSRAPSRDDGPTAATTLTLAVTNQKLPYWALQRFAIQVHTSMARGIQPFHTSRDGDVLFAVSTDEVDNSSLPAADLGVIAGEVAWDAILSSVPDLDAPDTRQTVRVDRKVLARYAGEYEFAPGVRARVSHAGEVLTVAVTRSSFYITAGQQVPLAAVSDTDFRLQNDRAALVRFDVDAAGIVRGFTINPGHWPIRASRLQ